MNRASRHIPVIAARSLAAPRRLRRGLPLVLLLMLLTATALSGCGALDDTRATVSTVDDSVALLQDLDRRAAGDTLRDGFDALIDSGAGFVAEATIAPPPGDTAATPALHLTFTVDADGHAVISVSRADGVGPAEHYWADLSTGDEPRAVYGAVRDAATSETTPASYCVPDEAAADWLGAGLPGVFDRYGLQMLLQQTLAVTEWDEDAEPEQAGREGDLYQIESRMDDALALLSDFDNEDLRARVAASEAGNQRARGSVVLDEGTAALLSLELVVSDARAADSDPATAGLPVARFVVTQWGDVAALPTPPDASISGPCP